MKNSILLFPLLFVLLLSCAQPPKNFDEKALNSMSFDIEGNEVSFQTILEKHKGKKVFKDIWASWCHDCIGSLPKVKVLREKTDASKVDFVFLSVDKDQFKWKTAIKKYDLLGDHYYQKAGWESDFNKSIDLDWIPRYMVVDEKGEIILFKSIEADDTELLEALK